MEKSVARSLERRGSVPEEPAASYMKVTGRQRAQRRGAHLGIVQPRSSHSRNATAAHAFSASRAITAFSWPPWPPAIRVEDDRRADRRAQQQVRATVTDSRTWGGASGAGPRGTSPSHVSGPADRTTAYGPRTGKCGHRCTAARDQWRRGHFEPRPSLYSVGPSRRFDRRSVCPDRTGRDGQGGHGGTGSSATTRI